MGPKKYSLWRFPVSNISWAQIIFLGVGIARAGVLGGLFHKERTGKGTLVDACLLRSGIFSMAAQVDMGGRVVQTSLRTFHW